MIKTAIFLATAAIFSLPVWAYADAHTYKASYQIADSVYGERLAGFDARDDFYFSNLSVRNSLNFVYSDNRNEAVVNDFSRLSDLLVVSAGNFRVSAMARGLYGKGLNTADNFRYFGSVERQIKISGAHTIDCGFALTNMAVYNKVYPGPVIFPLISWTYTSSLGVVRIGLPTLIMYRTQKWSAGLSYTALFNSRLFIKSSPISWFTLELFTDTNREQIVTGDPKRSETLNIFYAGVFLEGAVKFTDFTAFSLCGGYNIIERRWIGDQLSILGASQTYGSYKFRASLSFMF